MGLRTFNVKSAGRRPANLDQDLYNKNIDVGNPLTYPGGEYQDNTRGIYPREPVGAVFEEDQIGLYGEYKDAPVPARVNRGEPAGASRPDAVDLVLGTDSNPYPEDPTQDNTARNLRLASTAIDAIGGVANANSRHQDFLTSTNMKIMQASRQQLYVRSDAARAVLREGTKATERKGQALINAVAQGQSASGDLAQTAMNNEEVYAAQNAINIELNAMRSIYGLESEKVAMESNSRLSALNRNTTIAQNIIGAGAKAAVIGVS